jgi:hypothetical protein
MLLYSFIGFPLNLAYEIPARLTRLRHAAAQGHTIERDPSAVAFLGQPTQLSRKGIRVGTESGNVLLIHVECLTSYRPGDVERDDHPDIRTIYGLTGLPFREAKRGLSRLRYRALIQFSFEATGRR